MNDFVELRRVIEIVLRRWWLLVVLAIIAALAGYIVSLRQKPVYQATTTVLVGQSIKSPQLERVDIQTSDALVQTYVSLAYRQPVLEGVVTTLKLNTPWQELRNRITIKQVKGTQLIEIVAEGNSPRMARRIADEVANQLILLSPTKLVDTENYPFNNFNRQQIVNLQERIINGQKRLDEINAALGSPISEERLAQLQTEKAALELSITEWEKNYTGLLTLTRQERDSNQLTVIEPAYADSQPIRPRVKLNTIISGGLGVLIALGLIFLLDFLDDTYKSLSDFSQSEGLNILGSIGRIKGKKYSNKIIARVDPFSPITESYRIIRSRIQFRSGDIKKKSIMVISSVPQEGNSVTVANLGIVMAQANYKTVVVDANLRHPVLHQIFNVKNEIGLSDMLNSPETQVEDCLKKTWVNNLQLLTSGKPLPDPSERLGSKRMQEILIELKKIADIVIFDSPPSLVFADAIILSNQVDGVIVVIRAGKSKRSAVRQTLFDLQNAKANLLGSIFNQSPNINTFSMKEAYMPERTQKPFRIPLPFSGIKKSGVDRTQALFHDLRGLAMPTIEKSEMSGLESEKAGGNGSRTHDLGDSSTIPAIEKIETPEPVESMANETKTNTRQSSTKAARKTGHKKRTQAHNPTDSAIAHKSLETPSSEVERASSDEVRLHDLGDPAMSVNENLVVPSLDGEKVNVDDTSLSL